MVQFKVLKEFRLLDDPAVPGIGEIVTQGSTIDITVKRASEVEKNLDSSFLERIKEEKEPVVDSKEVETTEIAKGDE